MNMQQIITSNKTILAAALLTLGLTGCASTQTLNYQAQTGVAHVAHAENVAVNIVTTDSRADKVIGYMKSAIGLKIVSINSDEPIDKIVNNALEQELKTRGFTMNTNSGLIVKANVTQFDNDFDMHIASADANAISNIEFSVINNGVVLYKKHVIGKNTEVTYLVVPPSLAKKSLEKALANAMTELFNDPAFIAALTTAAPAQAATN
jgi:uncharacterized lipoprotein YajG